MAYTGEPRSMRRGTSGPWAGPRRRASTIVGCVMSQPTDRPAAEDDTQAWGDAAGDPDLRDLSGITLGDFRVERLLGRGGMGNVYLARQLSLNRPVALKVLRPDLLTKPTYLKRFEAEAWAVAKLNHPNIVQIHTLGHVDDIRFIAMEYVQGTNLRDLILKKGPLDLPLALSIMKQVGRGRRRGGRGRPDPSRHQAREHPADPEGSGQGRRLRPLPRSGRRRAPGDAARRDDGDPAVHEPRAGAGQGARPPQRPVFAGRDVLSDDRGHPPVRRPDGARGGAEARQGRPGQPERCAGPRSPPTSTAWS